MSRLPYRWKDKALILNIRVQPGASRDEIAGMHGDQLRIRLRAPPVDGKANAGLVRFLAAVFDVTRGNVEILAGSGSRDKRIRVNAPRTLPDGIDPTRPHVV